MGSSIPLSPLCAASAKKSDGTGLFSRSAATTRKNETPDERPVGERSMPIIVAKPPPATSDRLVCSAGVARQEVRSANE